MGLLSSDPIKEQQKEVKKGMFFYASHRLVLNKLISLFSIRLFTLIYTLFNSSLDNRPQGRGEGT